MSTYDMEHRHSRAFAETEPTESTGPSSGEAYAGQPADIAEVIDASNDAVCNTSGNTPFGEVFAERASRRAVLAGGLGLAAASFFGMSDAADASPDSTAAFGEMPRKKLIGFKPVAVQDGNGPVPAISEDYEYEVVIPWGTALKPGGPEFNGDPDDRPTPVEQRRQIGIGHDGMWFYPTEYSHSADGSFHEYLKRSHKECRRGVLAINHEYGTNSHVLGRSAPKSLRDVRRSQNAHGVAVVEIKRTVRGKWVPVKSKYSRRIHVNTEVAFAGPVAGHKLLDNKAGNTPRGTVNNCANGYTPWGTYLTCEENFNGYFGATGSFTPSDEDDRYGFSAGGFGYGWEQFDERFDMSNPDYANERNRFGWVVEIDPMDRKQTPVKRTALGRFKHEGVAVTEGRGGKVVCYMGDDQSFDYIYRYVSAKGWQEMLDEGKSPLDEGTLYVAKFKADGTGKWLELTIDNPELAARFKDQAEVLTYARIAADILGATPMDRPEWTTVAPNGDVYCTLTNNSQRTDPNPANPIAPNYDGHIIKWRDSKGHTGDTFEWDIFLISQDTHDTKDTFSSPDGLWADPDGRLFIETDGGQKDGLNNQLLVADTATGNIRRLFTGVTDCEITGIAVTPCRTTLFVNIQHPGNGDPAVTNFPAKQGSGKIPRDCTIAIRRKDGGIVGS